MTVSDHLDRALQRLAQALDRLDAAAARRAEADAARVDADLEWAAMQDDRTRLALDLDAALDRARALEGAQVEVSRRLARAGVTVRAILADIGRDEAADAPAEPA